MKQKQTLTIIVAMYCIAVMITLITAAFAATREKAADQLLYSSSVIDHLGEQLAEIEPAMLRFTGTASYYDYVLDSGWSSVGHFVCATRVPEWRKHMIRVTDISTGKSVSCLVTDFGPDAAVHPDRVVDLSSTAFAALKPLKYGLVQQVKVELMQ